MPARLRLHAAARIHQQDGQVGGGRAGDHVARVLLVPRRVGDDELALVGGKEAVGHVDGDALFALGGQAVHQQGEVEVFALRAHLLRVGFELRQLVLEQHLRLIQQPADQRALAVVDAAAGDEAQQALALLGTQVVCDVVMRRGWRGVDQGFHQKYPSCFFFSIEPAESLSISRPWRSDVVASSISRMMPPSVSASLSIAPVSG
ncbi:hypothetical protein D9M72_411190 [compost metagenome]